MTLRSTPSNRNLPKKRLGKGNEVARLVEEITSDFSAGMFDSTASTRYPAASVALALNARIEPDGTIRRRSGTIKTHSAALEAATGFGAIEFTTAAGVDQLVVIFGAKAFMSTDKGATFGAAIATGLRTDYYSFATMRVGATNYLYMANGDTTVKRWDGSTWDTNPNAPSGVKYLAVFNGRLWYGGHSGVILQATQIADPSVIASPNGLTVQILTHGGDVPTGLYQVGPHLLVYDRSATSYVDGFGEQTIIVATGATGFSRSVGCVGFRTIVGVGDNAVCWLSERGVEYYSPGAGITLVSKAVRTFLQSIDWEQVYENPGRASAAYDETDQNYHLGLATKGVRNDRVLVLNLRQNVQYQRPGLRSAATVDRLLSPDGGTILFGGDSDGYLTAVAGGAEATSDGNGYMSLVSGAESGDPVDEDANGYIQVVTNDTLPASLFVSRTTDRTSTLHSLGYDGFVRKHYGVDNDDMASDETGGTAVAMTVVSRPFLFRRPRQKKRVRAIHVATLNDASATVTVLLRSGGKPGPEQTVTMPATALNQSTRKRAMTRMVGDAPQVEIRSTDDIRLSLAGVSAELMKEPV